MTIARRKCRLVSGRTAKNSVPASSLEAKPGVVLDLGSSRSLSKVRDSSEAPVVADPDDSDKNDGAKAYFCEPRTLDICCGRGKGSFCQPGNLIFQEVIRKNLDRYEQANSKKLRSGVVSAIVCSLHLERSLRFIKKDPVIGKWYVLSINEAHEKTGHAIRDQLSLMRRKELSLQEETSLPMDPPMACPVSISSQKSKSSTTTGVDCRPVPRKTKHQVEKKKVKKTIRPKQQALDQHFHHVSVEEEAHRERWSDLVVEKGPAVPSSLSSDDGTLHLDDDQHDYFTNHMLTLPLLPQGHHSVSLQNMSPLSTLPTDFPMNSTSPCRVSPESNREVYVRPSTLQRTTNDFNTNEDDLEPIPLPYFPPPAEYIQTSCHRVVNTTFYGNLYSPEHSFGF